MDDIPRGPQICRYTYTAGMFSRQPFVMFVLGPVYNFLILNLIPLRSHGRARFRGVLSNDPGLAVHAAVFCASLVWRHT